MLGGSGDSAVSDSHSLQSVAMENMNSVSGRGFLQVLPSDVSGRDHPSATDRMFSPSSAEDTPPLPARSHHVNQKQPWGWGQWWGGMVQSCSAPPPISVVEVGGADSGQRSHPPSGRTSPVGYWTLK